MSRTKTWTKTDRALAILWIESKAENAIFAHQKEEIERMLSALKSEKDPIAFGRSLKLAMVDSAYRKMLGSMRQARHEGRHHEAA